MSSMRCLVVCMASLRVAVVIFRIMLHHVTVRIPRRCLLFLVSVQTPTNVPSIRRLVMARVVLVVVMRRRVLLVMMLVRLALIAFMFIFARVTSINDKQRDAQNDQKILHGAKTFNFFNFLLDSKFSFLIKISQNFFFFKARRRPPGLERKFFDNSTQSTFAKRLK